MIEEIERVTQRISAIVKLKESQDDYMSKLEVRRILRKLREVERFAESRLTDYGWQALQQSE